MYFRYVVYDIYYNKVLIKFFYTLITCSSRIVLNQIMLRNIYIGISHDM